MKVKSAAPQLCAACRADITADASAAAASKAQTAMLTKSLRTVAESDADPAARENAIRAIAEIRTATEYGTSSPSGPAVSPTAQRLSGRIPRTVAQAAAQAFYEEDDPARRESYWRYLTGQDADWPHPYEVHQ